MAKFVIECPHCGAYNEASTSIFSKKNIQCTCGMVINIKKDKMKSIVCPHCKNTVVYDQSKGNKAVCPICKEKLATEDALKNTAEIKCPTCSCELTVDKNATTYTCPLCDTTINVKEQILKQNLTKDGIISVIKYEGPNDVLVWKHPVEDFNLGTQLIVHESQEAVFLKDGKALDSFGAGRYTLNTDNIPLLNKTYKLPTVSDTNMFHAEVYYVNLTTQMGIKWGTDTRIRMFDPATGMHVELGACGEFNIKVNDPRKLLIKVVGTTGELNQNDLMGSDYSNVGMKGKFKALVTAKVKSFLAKTIREEAINILEVDEHIEEISNVLKNEINRALEAYGLIMPEFFITTIMTPDDDPNFKRLKEQYAEKYLLVAEERIKKAEAEAAQQRKMVEAQTAAQEEIIKAQASAEAYRLKAEAEAKEMQMKGYTYQQETQRQVAKAAMENQGQVGGVTGLMNDMVGLGVGLGVMGEVASTVKNTVNPTLNLKEEKPVSQNKWTCPNCHSEVTTLFCPNCGSKKPTPNNTWVCPNCGKSDITTPFCPECGCKKPTTNNTWDCECGMKNITTPFCPNCGTKKGE